MRMGKAMTSFMDIMSILLLGVMLIAILLVTTSKSRESYQNIDLPKQQHSSAANTLGEQDLIVSLSANGKIVVEAHGKQKRMLISSTTTLQTFLAKRLPDRLFIRADRKVPYGKVADIIELAKSLNIRPGIALVDKGKG